MFYKYEDKSEKINKLLKNKLLPKMDELHQDAILRKNLTTLL